jgi:hypothetical protein
MPANITDVSTFTAPVTTPIDGDPATGASVLAGLQALANRTRHLHDLFKVDVFTPTVFTDATDNVTMSLQDGAFVRVGDLVVANFRVTGNIGASTGQVALGGLPYKAKWKTGAMNTFLPVYQSAAGAFGSGYGLPLMLNIEDNSVAGFLFAAKVGAAASASIGGGWVASQAFDLFGVVSYRTQDAF